MVDASTLPQVGAVPKAVSLNELRPVAGPSGLAVRGDAGRVSEANA